MYEWRNENGWIDRDINGWVDKYVTCVDGWMKMEIGECVHKCR